jgi:hypothetical protein
MGSCVSCRSRESRTVFSLIQHFDGDSWSIVESPHFPSGEVLKAIQAVSAQDIFAVGSFMDQFQTQHPLVEHFDGTAWTIVPTPQFERGQGALLNSIAVISDSDIWAVGCGPCLDVLQVTRTSLEHWDGTQWTVSPAPNPEAPAIATSVSGFPSGSVFIAGEQAGGCGGAATRVLTTSAGQ